MSIFVCMGVSGVGKSAVAKGLAARLGGIYLDADDLHSPENKQKMARGIPLTDTDRWGWLDALNAELGRWSERAGPSARIFLACSALKQSYRERLRKGLHDVRFVYLRAPFDTVQERLRTRSAHFMPASLLASQFATLEEPSPDAAIYIDARAPLPDLIEQVMTALGFNK